MASPPRGPVRWLHALGFGRPRPDESVALEIEHHLGEVTDQLVGEGWTIEEARREAERRFGDRSRYAPRMRRLEARGRIMERWLVVGDVLRHSLSSAVRAARRQPGFAAAVVLTLGLGIGANATMYGIIDRLLLQPPTHLVDADRVRRVFIERPSPLTGQVVLGSVLTYPDYVDLKAHSGMTVAAYRGSEPATVEGTESVTRAEVSLASAELFDLLGVTPRYGRFFTPDEAAPGAALTAVIGAAYWERAFGSDPEVLGRAIEVDGRRHRIVGIAPEAFTGVGLSRVDMWLPLEATHVAARSPDGHCLEGRGCYWMGMVARLHDGTTDEAAEEEATALHRNGRGDMIAAGRYTADARVVLGSVISARGPDASSESRVARWLLGVSLIVLLIACANVANLLMARATRQRRETGVRLALGAPRGRLAAHAIAESVLLAAAGGVLALALARWGGALLRSTLLPGVYFPASALTPRLVVFTVACTLLAGLVAGVAPALQASRVGVVPELGDGARGASARRSLLRGSLTVAQAAMSVVLLVGAGLFVRSLGELRALDLGMDVDRLVLVRLELRDPNLDRARQDEIYAAAARRLSALPGVHSTAATGVPFGWAYAWRLRVPGIDSIPRLPGGGPYHYTVTPEYFETVGLAVMEGRSIAPSDDAGAARVAVVNETMARTLWPDGDALGRCLHVGEGSDGDACIVIVGIAEDAARGGYDDAAYMAFYLSAAQTPGMPHQGLYVRAEDNADGITAEVARTMRSFSPDVRYAEVQTLREMLDPQARSWTLGATMFTVFGLLALLVASIGLYSVLAFDVAQRTREIGIRSALGAEKQRLLASILLAGTRLAMLGIALGILAAYLATPWLEDLLFEVSPRDPAVLGGVAVLLLIVSVAAAAVPGRRATQVDPATALRAE